MYEAAIAEMRRQFPYRKWRISNGEFCGVQYVQCPETFEISYQQKEYAKNLRPINLTKQRLKHKNAKANDREISSLRAINGAANWLNSQSRPDLCTDVIQSVVLS